MCLTGSKKDELYWDTQGKKDTLTGNKLQHEGILKTILEEFP